MKVQIFSRKILRYSFSRPSPNNCLFMCQLGYNKKLAETFPGLAHIKEKHNYNTRSA